MFWWNGRIKSCNVHQSVVITPWALDLHKERVAVVRACFPLGPLDDFVDILCSDNVILERSKDVLTRLLRPEDDAVVVRRDLRPVLSAYRIRHANVGGARQGLDLGRQAVYPGGPVLAACVVSECLSDRLVERPTARRKLQLGAQDAAGPVQALRPSFKGKNLY